NMDIDTIFKRVIEVRWSEMSVSRKLQFVKTSELMPSNPNHQGDMVFYPDRTHQVQLIRVKNSSLRPHQLGITSVFHQRIQGHRHTEFKGGAEGFTNSRSDFHGVEMERKATSKAEKTDTSRLSLETAGGAVAGTYTTRLSKCSCKSEHPNLGHVERIAYVKLPGKLRARKTVSHSDLTTEYAGRKEGREKRTCESSLSQIAAPLGARLDFTLKELYDTK
ncbi:unnamed protein product, partial [Nesidiocoris tenuis]